MLLQENFNLQGFNTLAVPSTVALFASASSCAELGSALAYAKAAALPIEVLGGGSNVILAPAINACVLQLKFHTIEVVQQDADRVLIKAGAGVNWHSLVLYCTRHGFYGIENLALIPGDVGAAPIQNIGAYGVELKDVFQRLEAIDIATGEVVSWDKPACEFGYRDSVFKQAARGKFIIVSVTFSLTTVATVNVTYPALAEQLQAHGVAEAGPMDVLTAVIAIRQSKLPDPAIIPNAGSFFKNPVVPPETYHNLKQAFPGLVGFDAEGGAKKLSAAWMIDQLGWKGRWVSGVQVHPQHALVLTNPNRETAHAILSAAQEISASVKQRFAVALEMEPQCLGEFT